MRKETFTILKDATTSNYIAFGPERLEALILPALDSTTITFEVSLDGSASKGIVNKAVDGSAVAALTMGNANTGAIVQRVPEDVSLLSQTPVHIRLVTAAQNTANRTITALVSQKKS